MNDIKKTIGMYEQENGLYDLEIAEDGDLRVDDSYDTDIYVSLFTDRRADSSEIQDAKRRRGWQGDVVSPLEDYLLGSKLWLDKQTRWTQETVNDMVADAEGALRHFVDRGLCTRVGVDGSRLGVGQIRLSIVFYVENNAVKTINVDIWKQSKFA